MFGVALALVAVGLVALVVGLTHLFGAPQPVEAEMLSMPVATDTPDSTALASVSPTQAVEVPDVTGASIEEARIVLEAAGFSVSFEESGAVKSAEVTSQTPVAGTVAEGGAIVVLGWKPAVKGEKSQAAEKEPGRRWVVCIDPGHQEHADQSPEPIGPGSKKQRPAVAAGTTGVETDLPEYEVVLQVSMNLKKRLEAEGVKVVMTRTTNDVNLSNSKRAAIANKAKADLFVRVHADGSPDGDVSGISTLYPGSTKWTKATTKPSKSAARTVQEALIGATGAIDRGTKARTDLSGFNHCTRTAILVECGFMSNPVEDRLLSSPHYQDKLAIGATKGILAYLEGLGE